MRFKGDYYAVSLLFIVARSADLTCVDPTPAQLAAIPGFPTINPIIPGLPISCGILEANDIQFCTNGVSGISPTLCPASCNTCVRQIDVGFANANLLPFQFYNKNAAQPYTGLAVDLTRALVAEIPNALATEHAVNYETLMTNTQVNVAPYFINPASYKAQKHMEISNMSFSANAFNLPFRVLTHYAKESTDPMTGMFLPFTGEVWGAVLGTVIGIGAVMIFLEKTSSSAHTNDTDDHEGYRSRPVETLRTHYFFSGWYYTLTTLLGDGIELIDTTSTLGRLCRLGLVFFCFIFQATYTANLASILTRTSAVYGVTSINDLRNARICFPDEVLEFLISPEVISATLGFDVTANAIRASDKFPDLNVQNTTNPQDLQAQEQLERQRILYCMDEVRSKRADAIVGMELSLSQYLSYVTDCSSFKIVPDLSFGVTNFGQRVLIRNQADWMLLHAVNEAIFRSQSNGKLGKILDKHHSFATCAESTSTMSDLQISFDTFYGVFVYTGAIVLLSIMLWPVRNWRPHLPCNKQKEELSSITSNHTEGSLNAANEAHFSECELSAVPSVQANVQGAVLQDMQRQILQIFQAALNEANGADQQVMGRASDVMRQCGPKLQDGLR